ncbi:MAG TPA: NAD(P)-dependent oxidoreductase [Verrucomicrobiae bacterium]|nr:NAD(P)-dependent oxidoreductase [Verrucomicrobiae bacterium]
MKVLLTGGAGFIGSHVARELVRQNHEVHALVRPQSDLRRVADIEPSLRIIHGDLIAPSFVLQPASYDCCLHLAWYVEPGKYLHAPQNKDWVQASLRLARMLQTAGCRHFIGAGTCFEYAPADPPQRESTPTQPTTPYVQAKLELFDALQSVGIESAWLRFFYQYGPGEDPRRLVPAVINTLLRNQEMKLVPGDRVRDYLHIEDVATAACAVAGSCLTGAVNIGSGEPVTVREIAWKIGETLDRVSLLKVGALPYPASEPMHLLADNTKLREGTGWKPHYPLDEGLRRTIEWWKNR